MQTTDLFPKANTQLLMPDALSIAAMKRQILHEKIVRLRALREAADAAKALTDTKAPARRRQPRIA